MKKTIVAAAVLLSTVSAIAGSLDCSSADSKIQYQTRQSDGGAAMRRSVLLRVNGEDVVNIQPIGDAELVKGKIELGAKKTAVKVTKTKDYRTSYYNVIATVSDLAGKVLASDIVHCKEIVYVGVPRP